MLHQTIPLFRFQLGQKIRCNGRTDEGHPYADVGYIIGQCVTIPSAMVPGNWYLVEWVSLPYDRHLSPGHLSWEHEDMLETA